MNTAAAPHADAPTDSHARVVRIEVRPEPVAGDPEGDRLVREAAAMGVSIASARTAKVYLIEPEDGHELAGDVLDRVTGGLLASPVTESVTLGSRPIDGGVIAIEVHPLPGVMDPAGQTVRDALHDLYGIDALVTTVRRYELAGIDEAAAIDLAGRLLSNPVVSGVHAGAYWPVALPKGEPAAFELTTVPIRGLDDDGLERLSRDGHLFLSLDEMRAIRAEYESLGREPTDIELETLAQTWSEHCVHKTLKSRIVYRRDRGTEAQRHKAGEAGAGLDPINWEGRPGHVVHPDGTIEIDNLLKRTVAAATVELMEEDPNGLGAWCLSVFVDNAGIVAFDDDHAVCVKVETHNHPSALEPYGGAATGIGGCIRDIIGTGLAAKPIASTDVFCVANADAEVPEGCLPPSRVLSEVVAGVRDYGNRMGIPTVNGAVWFDDRYVGNPLVYCGCIGVMPRGEGDANISGEPRPGDRIIALGGRTGRDGIHGATFSSAELTDTHADEFSHAVQIGNPIEEKRVLDAILRARDFVAEEPGTRDQASGRAEEGGSSGCPVPVARCLFSAITDCGAGGFSSAVGEMGERVGAEVDLEKAPLKYAGLTYTEIWISEAQERMVLAVPPGNVAALQAICDEEGVELADLGQFGASGEHGPELVLRYDGTEVGRLPMSFVHDGLPEVVREAEWRSPDVTSAHDDAPSTKTIPDTLLELLAHPNIASKHEIIRQYDHEVQGNTVIKPLGGPMQRGPMDAAVIEPVPGTGKGLAIACGLATSFGDPDLGGDPYVMALAAIDECVRNLVCVGADPSRIAILDNFCWPSCKKPENLAGLVRAAEGCYDGAKAYKTPFISGKDSLNNQFTIPAKDGRPGRTIEIPPTLLITGIGEVVDVNECVTMDAKRAGNRLVYIRQDAGHAEPSELARTVSAVASFIAQGLVLSAHDVSDGGVLCAIAEMLIAGSTPAEPIGTGLNDMPELDAASAWFTERPGEYVLEVREDADIAALSSGLPSGATAAVIATLDDSGVLSDRSWSVPVEDLAAAWLGTVRV